MNKLNKKFLHRNFGKITLVKIKYYLIFSEALVGTKLLVLCQQNCVEVARKIFDLQKKFNHVKVNCLKKQFTRLT